MGGKIDKIMLCVAPKSKEILRHVLYVISFGFMYLINLWVPNCKVKLTLDYSNIHNAEFVIVYGADKNLEIVPLKTELISTGGQKVFTYRFFKYIYNEREKRFNAAEFNLSDRPCVKIRQEYEHGLDEAAVNDGSIVFGKNLTQVPLKPWYRLLVDEVLTPFYIFQVFSFIVWSLDDYAVYAGVIGLFTTISVVIAVRETMANTRKLYEMSYYETALTVWRKQNGGTKELKLSSAELVPGDIFVVPENVLIPCDAILLNGSCIMNESMLTGESIPVVKNAIPNTETKYDAKEDKQYTLYSGTKCI